MPLSLIRLFALQVFVALEPCDLRKSFNGLEGLVRERLQEDPRRGALFACSRFKVCLVPGARSDRF